MILRPNLAGDSVDCDACGHGEESEDCEDSCGSQLDKPFFLWFAPNQPHKKGRGEDYREIYDDGSGSYVYETKRLKHEGRITQFDQVVGTLIDELKRHCICGWQVDPDTGDGVTSGGVKVHEKQSLWQHTVLIFLADHGFFLPEAKRHDNENTHRTVLMVSEPRHRIIKTNGQPLLPARQYPNELVHAIDVFRTVLDYAGIPFSSAAGDPIAPASVYTGRDDYLFGRSLKEYVSDTTPPSGHIRDVVYGEHADQGSGLEDDVQRSATRNRYIVTRPGLIGICMNGTSPVQTGTITYNAEHSYSSTHARPCFLGGSHDCPSGTCQSVNRCINDPKKTCSDNSDCIEVSFCSNPTSGKCQYNWRGSLGDVARPIEPASGADDASSRACSYDTGESEDEQKDDVAAACVPTDVNLCQPVILKVLSKGEDISNPNNGEVSAAWDVNWDPDQKHNLLEDVDYLGDASSPSSDSLLYKFDACLDNYWTLDSAAEWAGSAAGCAWTEAALP